MKTGNHFFLFVFFCSTTESDALDLKFVVQVCQTATSMEEEKQAAEDGKDTL